MDRIARIIGVCADYTVGTLVVMTFIATAERRARALASTLDAESSGRRVEALYDPVVVDGERGVGGRLEDGAFRDLDRRESALDIRTPVAFRRLRTN